MSMVKLRTIDEEQLRTELVEAYIRMFFKQNEYATKYILVKNINDAIGEDLLNTKNVDSIINQMPEIQFEPTTNLYYMCESDPEANKQLTAFQRQIDAALASSSSEKIRSILQAAPDTILAAAKQGRRQVVIAELTQAEWGLSIIPKAVCTVLKKRYGIEVIMRSYLDLSTAVSDRLPPFEDDAEPMYYKQDYFLIAELRSSEDITHQRIACRELKKLTLNETDPSNINPSCIPKKEIEAQIVEDGNE